MNIYSNKRHKYNHTHSPPPHTPTLPPTHTHTHSDLGPGAVCPGLQSEHVHDGALMSGTPLETPGRPVCGSEKGGGKGRCK